VLREGNRRWLQASGFYAMLQGAGVPMTIEGPVITDYAPIPFKVATPHPMPEGLGSSSLSTRPVDVWPKQQPPPAQRRLMCTEATVWHETGNNSKMLGGNLRSLPRLIGSPDRMGRETSTRRNMVVFETTAA
jgi:muramoyltetrapeptide carboxypeptidase LdcA involved in peptidoglycan recycling